MPAEGVDEHPADERGDDRRRECGPGEDRDGGDELLTPGAAQHDQASDGHHQRSPEALQDPPERQFDEPGRRGAQRGRDGEERDRPGEDRARPDTVGQPAADRDEHRERDEVGGDGHTDRGGVDAEVAPHGRGGGREDRAVQELHEEGARDEHGHRRAAPSSCRRRRRHHPECYARSVSAPGPDVLQRTMRTTTSLPGGPRHRERCRRTTTHQRRRTDDDRRRRTHARAPSRRRAPPTPPRRSSGATSSTTRTSR